MPRVYFGFDAQSVPGEHIFLSYSRTDAERIKGIALELHKKGLPIWYDDGLIPGNLWKKEIRRQVKESRVTVFFLTKELFQRNGTFMIDEYQFAKDHGKPKICIFLDDIANMDCVALADEMYFWWLELKKIQSIEVINLPSDKEKADEIFHGLCRADRKFTQYASTTESKPNTNATPKSIRQPQPPSPTFQPPVSKAEQKPVIQKSVKHTPLIVTVAVVLVIAMVSGIWAISHSNSNPASDLTSSSSSESTDDSTESESSEKTGSQSDSTSDSSDNSTESVKSLSELGSVSVGDHFTFGNYPQGANGEEQPIEWRVLAVEDGKALVVSKKLLDCVEYNETRIIVTWETCTLRKWMNNDFISKAFSSSQQAKLATVTNENRDNPDYHTSGGNATQDRIFALSTDEAEKYFRSDEDRLAAPTEYAKKQGCFVSDNYSLPTGEKTGWWWLRSPGINCGYAAYVIASGGVNQGGYNVFISNGAVRPAFWLNL
jgi:hypothetical protein